MKKYHFVNCVTAAEILTVTRQHSKIYRFRTQEQSKPITSESLFWQAAIDTFPLSPRVKAPGQSMDVLADSLFGGLLGSSDLKADIVWAYVDNIKRDFLKSQVQFFHQLAINLHPENKLRIDGGEGGIELVLHLVCSNDANCQAICDYLSSYNLQVIEV